MIFINKQNYYSKLASSIIKIVFAGWTGTNPVKYLVDDSSNLFTDLFKDHYEQRRASRTFDSMVDEASKYITSRLEFEVINVTDMVALEIELCESIKKSDLTSRKLADLSYKESLVIDLLKKSNKLNTKHYSDSEIQVYSLLIEITAKLIIDFSNSMPDYNKSSTESILNKLDIIDNRIEELIKRYNNEFIQLSEKLFNHEEVEFSRYDIKYCDSILRVYDNMELIGVNIDRKHRKYQLSTSFVQLALYDGLLTDEKSEENQINSFEMNSIEHLINNTYDDILIIGDAGTGKSTILRWIAINTIRSFSEGNEEVLFPLILELRNYNKNIPIPENYFDLFKKNTISLPPIGWIESKFSANKCILLLDGIDEISKNQRIKIFEWIADLKDLYNIRIIATSRPSAKEWIKFRNELNFLAFHIANMNYKSISLFSERWHNTCFEDNVKEGNIKHQSFMKKISASKSLLNLSSNPLLCAILCALNNQGMLKNDSSRKELYEDCISMLIEQRDSVREISSEVVPDMTYSQKRALLDELSYWMVKNGYVKVSKKFVKDKFEMIANTFQVGDFNHSERIDNLIERNAILREKSNTYLDFIHKSFMEFMAASQICKVSDWGLLNNNLTNDMWTDVAYMSMCFASQENANTIISTLLKHGNENAKYNFIAMECMKRAVSVDKDIQGRVNEIIKDLIPPKTQSDMVALIKAENHVVPFLEYNPEMSVETIRLYTKMLSEIPTKESYTVFTEYFHSNLSVNIYEELVYRLSLFPAIYHLDSRVSDEFLKRINHYKDSNGYSHVSGRLLDLLSNFEEIDFTRIDLENVSKIYFTGYCDELEEFICLFKHIEELIIHSSGMTLDFLSKFDNLEHLTLDVRDDFVSSFSDLQNVKNLHELVIDLKNYTKDHGLYTNTLQPLTQLKRLVIINVDNIYLLEEILKDAIVDNRECKIEIQCGSGITVTEISDMEKYHYNTFNNFVLTQSDFTA